MSSKTAIRTIRIILTVFLVPFWFGGISAIVSPDIVVEHVWRVSDPSEWLRHPSTRVMLLLWGVYKCGLGLFLTFFGVLGDSRSVWKAAACILPIQFFYAFAVWFPQTIGFHATPLFPRIVALLVPPTVAICLLASSDVVFRPRSSKEQ